MIALFERLLLRAIEAVCIALLLALTGAVIYSTTMRYLGASPSWYDELASVMLAWLTYFGATYAVFMRHHMSFSGLVTAMPRGLAVAMLSSSLSRHIFTNAHTHTYSFSHIAHIRVYHQHAARAPDGRLRLSSHH